MYEGHEIVSTLVQLGVTHVVWLPDSEMGPWERVLEDSPSLELIRVCREGEAWALAAGLYIGGKNPIIMIQCTGLFESGDALRNVVFDMRLPIFAIVGYRSYLVEDSPDTAKQFAEPILKAWGIDYVLLTRKDELGLLVDHYRRCLELEKPGVALLAEGRM